MVFQGAGLTYTELTQMDMEEFYEAASAWNLWQEERKNQ